MADMEGHDVLGDDMEDLQDGLEELVEEGEEAPVAAVDDPFELLYKHHPETIKSSERGQTSLQRVRCPS